MTGVKHVVDDFCIIGIKLGRNVDDFDYRWFYPAAGSAGWFGVRSERGFTVNCWGIYRHIRSWRIDFGELLVTSDCVMPQMEMERDLNKIVITNRRSLDEKEKQEVFRGTESVDNQKASA